MTFLERLAIYVTTACMILIYMGVAVLPIVLYWLTYSGWWFALYVVIAPAMLIVAAIVERIAIEKEKK